MLHEDDITPMDPPLRAAPLQDLRSLQEFVTFPTYPSNPASSHALKPLHELKTYAMLAFLQESVPEQLFESLHTEPVNPEQASLFKEEETQQRPSHASLHER